MRLIGAALPRTGTMSLSHALRDLTGEGCYHMTEMFHRPHDAVTWRAASRGESVDWRGFLAGYAAGVDTPLCVHWREISEVFPDAKILLTRRKDAATWWSSMEATVLPHMRSMHGYAASGAAPRDGEGPPWLQEADPADREALVEVFGSLAEQILGSAEAMDDPALGVAAYDAWLADVRAAVPAERLVEWQPGDGWEPLCAALDAAVPEREFPHDNSREDFTARSQDGGGKPPRPGAE
ncbi:sulfotransferase family protein [Marmoricola endophyticus]|uniref:Sulfotransferase family protein n=1 Tax=Marmoricola endophyticus TaxID=2040280 RepID=A0A917BQE0_9ACTN|nr:sulfotransferase family protein [Marmoricola endophyticus]GGF55125.1 sulfotransferase family protein [Marmoricola endophyticus]